jgi:hypothetical protein
MKIRLFAAAIGLMVLAMISFNCGSCSDTKEQAAVEKPAAATKKIRSKQMDRSKAVRQIRPMTPAQRSKRAVRRSPDGKPVMRMAPRQKFNDGRNTGKAGHKKKLSPVKARAVDPRALKGKKGKKAKKEKKGASKAQVFQRHSSPNTPARP